MQRGAGFNSWRSFFCLYSHYTLTNQPFATKLINNNMSLFADLNLLIFISYYHSKKNPVNHMCMLHCLLACMTNTSELTLCVPEDTLFFVFLEGWSVLSTSPPSPPFQRCWEHVHKPHLAESWPFDITHSRNKNKYVLPHACATVSTCPVKPCVCLMFCQRRLLLAQ